MTKSTSFNKRSITPTQISRWGEMFRWGSSESINLWLRLTPTQLQATRIQLWIMTLYRRYKLSKVRLKRTRSIARWFWSRTIRLRLCSLISTTISLMSWICPRGSPNSPFRLGRRTRLEAGAGLTRTTTMCPKNSLMKLRASTGSNMTGTVTSYSVPMSRATNRESSWTSVKILISKKSKF